MNPVQQLFLEAYVASLKNIHYELKIRDYSTFVEFFRLASIQEVLPMICNSVFESSCIKNNPKAFSSYKELAIQKVSSQIVRTSQFLDLYSYLEKRGLHPIIVKGLALRNIYPKSNFRTSCDEDILIQPEEKYLYHEALLEYGMSQLDSKEDIDTSFEMSYIQESTGLYIEAHQYLIPPESKAYGDLNKYFKDINIEYIEYNGHLIRTLDVTSHVFFLICHSFKHFLHSGFGIRQISDLVIFSSKYADCIDWGRIEAQSKDMNAFDFVRAMYKIGTNLLPENNYLTYIKDWDIESIDDSSLLLDVLESGVHGASDITRLHSSNITLNAVSSSKEQKKKKNSVFSSVFLPVNSLKGKYTYLESYPFLLPVAWIQRVSTYLKEQKNSKEVVRSLKLGNERVALLKQYKIIK
ncbi:MAG: nucleotidyltransferase family protein [Firmicutes bacterium]|nr:nucleotidyltransferase family protein [Bacillota bacterium]